MVPVSLVGHRGTQALCSRILWEIQLIIRKEQLSSPTNTIEKVLMTKTISNCYVNVIKTLTFFCVMDLRELDIYETNMIIFKDIKLKTVAV